MTGRELKGLIAVTVVCSLAIVSSGIGLKLLGASSEVISVSWVVIVGFGALIGGFAFDRYTTPPDRH